MQSKFNKHVAVGAAFIREAEAAAGQVCCGSPGIRVPVEGRGGWEGAPKRERGDESWMLAFLLFGPAERRWCRPRVHISLSNPYATAASPPTISLMRKEGGFGESY